MKIIFRFYKILHLIFLVHIIIKKTHFLFSYKGLFKKVTYKLIRILILFPSNLLNYIASRKLNSFFILCKKNCVISGLVNIFRAQYIHYYFLVVCVILCLFNLRKSNVINLNMIKAFLLLI